MPVFTLSALARNDLKDIARYTERHWGREQRNHYLKQLDNVFHALAGSPSLGVACEYVKVGHRKLPHGSHVIYYKESSDSVVTIVRILHKSMDVDSNPVDQ